MRKAKVYSERRSRSIRFSWLDATCEFELRKSLGIKEKDLPALLFFQGNTQNRTFNYTGGWNEIKIRTQIDKIEFGKEKPGQSASFAFTDRDCVEFHKEMERLVKSNPDTTRKQALEEFLEEESKRHAEGGDAGKAKKRKNRRAEL